MSHRPNCAVYDPVPDSCDCGYSANQVVVSRLWLASVEGELESLRAQVIAQQAVIEQMREDAERYRYIRSRVKHAVPVVRIMIMDKGTYYLKETPSDLDTAIDRAREKK